MLLDQNLVFSDAQTASFTTSTPSTNYIDLTGGQTMNIGVGTSFGEDLGIGVGVGQPQIVVQVGSVALRTTNSATLNVQFQGNAVATSAADTNWITYIETGAMGASLLDAYNVIARFAWPRRQIEAAMPRYVRLNYNIAGSIFTTGNISAFIVLTDDEWNTKYYPSGFSVGA